eukprot:105147_1
MVKVGLVIQAAALVYITAIIKFKKSPNRYSIPFGLAFFYILYKIHDIGCWRYKLKNKSVPILCHKPGFGSLLWVIKHHEHEYHSKLTRICHRTISQTNEKFLILGAPKVNSNPNFGYHLFDARIIKLIFQDTFDNYVKGPAIHDPFEELIGDGIFTADGPRWRAHRKVAARMFSMRNLKRHMFGCALTNSRILLHTMEDLSGDQYQNELNLYDLFGRFTLQSFIEVAFGTKLNIIQSYPTEDAFCSAFDRLLNSCEMRYIDPLWKMKRFFKIGQREGVDIPQDAEVLNAFCDQMIEDKNKRQHIADETGMAQHDLLSLFLQHGATERKELRDITINFVVAARDTTRVLLSWFFYELTKAENAEILENIYDEIDKFKSCKLIYGDCAPYLGGTTKKRNFVNRESAGLTPMRHGEMDCRKYQYLEAVICEILRLYPPVTMLQRYAKKDDIEIEYKTLDGKDRILKIDKGDGVCVHTPSYLRLPHIWGTYGRDPNKINVENFFKNGVNTYSPYTFPVFNVQPRMCLGKTAALLQAKVVLISILRKYKIVPVKDQVVTHVLSPLYVMKNGFKVRIAPRNVSHM